MRHYDKKKRVKLAMYKLYNSLKKKVTDSNKNK